MMAVVDYVEKKQTEPPPELVLGWEMRTFGGLPENGGMLEQPVELMKMIRVALNIESLWRTYRRIKPGGFLKWKEANPDDWKTVKYIEELMNG